MIERMDFADGKYTVINDNGNLSALRHGEPWQRDLVGDNLVYLMLVDAIKLQNQRDQLLTAAQELLAVCYVPKDSRYQALTDMQTVIDRVIRCKN